MTSPSPSPDPAAQPHPDGAPVRKILIAPDKFKGSLEAADVAAAVSAGLLRVRPDLEIVRIPIADGGDGTVAAALAAGFQPHEVLATGPLGELRSAVFALRDGVAIVELAQASGLALMPDGGLDPLGATSRGTGDLIVAALDAGARTIVLGIGGSASTDGGAGMLRALGAEFLDAAGRELPDGGAALAGLRTARLGGLDPRLEDVEITLASDVDNPLLGPHGAAAVYGPQKGADPGQVALLDAALARFADVLEEALARPSKGLRDATPDSSGSEVPDARLLPGAGAAGGVGYAAMAALGAAMRPGVDIILEYSDFADAITDADLVITGEGRLDAQTLHGKGPAGVARRAKGLGIPVVAVCGGLDLTADELRGAGIRTAYALTDIEPDLAVCLAEPARLLEECGERIARDLP